ncbi:MAG: polysaccharide deacetylase family protein [Solirubrobacteraceae bacterium]
MSVISLTFDDGPDPDWTPALLDLLAELRAKATFFPIASRAAAAPGLIERMLTEEHAVGVHCAEHVRHPERDAEWLRRDTGAAIAQLRELGVEPVLWRTPWGDLAPFSEAVAADYGLQLVGWTADTHDWRGDSASDMFAAIGPSLRHGSIVLAHDGIGPGARRTTAQETVELVRLIGHHADAGGHELRALA